MTNISRAMTPALNAGKYPALVKHADEARTIFISAITALLLLICAVAQVRAQQYQTTNLVSDVPGLAPVTDPNLANPWGLIASSGSPWWVSNNGTGTSTLYNGAGVRQTLVVTVAGGVATEIPTRLRAPSPQSGPKGSDFVLVFLFPSVRLTRTGMQ